MGGGIGQWLLYRAADRSLSLFSLVVPAGSRRRSTTTWPGAVGLYRGNQDEEIYRPRRRARDHGDARSPPATLRAAPAATTTCTASARHPPRPRSPSTSRERHRLRLAAHVRRGVRARRSPSAPATSTPCARAGRSWPGGGRSHRLATGRAARGERGWRIIARWLSGWPSPSRSRSRSRTRDLSFAQRPVFEGVSIVAGAEWTRGGNRVKYDPLPWPRKRFAAGGGHADVWNGGRPPRHARRFDQNRRGLFAACRPCDAGVPLTPRWTTVMRLKEEKDNLAVNVSHAGDEDAEALSKRREYPPKKCMKLERRSITLAQRPKRLFGR